jgi:RND family efflux transporter MFP subunit
MNLKLIIIFALILLSSCSKKEESAPRGTYKVKTVIVKYMSSVRERIYPGEIKARDRSMLSFEIQGKIINSPRKDGEVVKKGDILAQIEVTDYKLNLDKAQAAYKVAKAEFDRAKILWASEAVSKSEFDSTKATYVSAKSEMEKVAKNYRNTTLRAPYDGRIAKVFVKNFEEVQAKQEIVKMYDPKKLDVKINIPESVLAKFDKNKQKVSATAYISDMADKIINLKFSEISSIVDVKSRTYETVFTIEDVKDLNLVPGMTINVKLNISFQEEFAKNTVLIPSIAVMEDSQKNRFVWIVDKKEFTAKKRVVKTGSISESKIEITSGLNEGERVIVAGAHLIQEGDKLELLEEAGGL